MEHDSKRKSPYKGVAIVCFFLIALPIICYLVIYGAFNNFRANNPSDSENRLTAFVFATGIGIFFHLSVAISGTFKEAKTAVKERMAEFRENLYLSLWFAIQSYLYDMKKNGIVYLIYMVIVLTNAVLCVLGIREYITNFL